VAFCCDITCVFYTKKDPIAERKSLGEVSLYYKIRLVVWCLVPNVKVYLTEGLLTCTCSIFAWYFRLLMHSRWCCSLFLLQLSAVSGIYHHGRKPWWQRWVVDLDSNEICSCHQASVERDCWINTMFRSGKWCRRSRCNNISHLVGLHLIGFMYFTLWESLQRIC